MQTETKKSAIDLTELAIGIIVLGVSVSIGAVILTKMAGTQVTGVGSSAVVNESAASVTETGVTLSKIWVKSVDTVINNTGGVIDSGNYTLTVNDAGYGTIKASSAITFSNNTDWNVSYSIYNTTDPRFKLPTDAALGLAEYGNWFKILVIVGISALIIALIFMAFGNRNSEAGVGY